MKSTLSPELITECKTKLLQMKSEILNRVRTTKKEFAAVEFTGDEIDQSVAALAEHSYLSAQERMRHQLMEIDFALARIHSGEFGICEETEEAIEPERLLAIPWTRLSIEGAEIREAMKKRYAK